MNTILMGMLTGLACLIGCGFGVLELARRTQWLLHTSYPLALAITVASLAAGWGLLVWRFHRIRANEVGGSDDSAAPQIRQPAKTEPERSRRYYPYDDRRPSYQEDDIPSSRCPK